MKINNNNNSNSSKENQTPNNTRPVGPTRQNPTNNDQLDSDFVNGLNKSAVIPPVSLGQNNDAPIEDEGLEDEEESSQES